MIANLLQETRQSSDSKKRGRQGVCGSLEPRCSRLSHMARQPSPFSKTARVHWSMRFQVLFAGYSKCFNTDFPLSENSFVRVPFWEVSGELGKLEQGFYGPGTEHDALGALRSTDHSKSPRFINYGGLSHLNALGKSWQHVVGLCGNIFAPLCFSPAVLWCAVSTHVSTAHSTHQTMQSILPFDVS